VTGDEILRLLAPDLLTAYVGADGLEVDAMPFRQESNVSSLHSSDGCTDQMLRLTWPLVGEAA
jgi:hypothetical protein